MNNFIKNNSLLIGSAKRTLSAQQSNSANYRGCANWNTSTIGNVTSVGSNGGPSAYGTYDQTGNVFEWNDRVLIVSGQNNRGVWGGSFLSSLVNIDGTKRSFQPQSSNGASEIGFRLISLNDPLNYVYADNSFVPVGDANNSSYYDGTVGSIGSVSYDYKIMKFTVTNTEYSLFLNSIAKTDTNTTYNVNMNNSIYGGISRSGTSGNFTYSVKSNFGNKPVNFVSWYRAARFANWLCNGRPTGPQNSTTTEDGAYTLSGNTGVPTLNNINPNTGLSPTYRLPTEDEWFKAAYYKGGSSNTGYWRYATQSNLSYYPSCVLASVSGNGSPQTVVLGNLGQYAEYVIDSTNNSMGPGFSRFAIGFNTGNSSKLNLKSIVLGTGPFPDISNGIAIYSSSNNLPNTQLYLSSVNDYNTTNEKDRFDFNVNLQSNTTYWIVPLNNISWYFSNTIHSINTPDYPVAYYNSDYSFVDTATASSLSGPWTSYNPNNSLFKIMSVSIEAI